MNDGERFARVWCDAWNSLDVDRVLTLWAAGAVFVSPLAEEITGSAMVIGRDAVGAYWREAMRRVPELCFALEDVLFDEHQRAVTILYRAQRGSAEKLAGEIIWLNDTGTAVRGVALYGGRPVTGALAAQTRDPRNARIFTQRRTEG